MGCRASRWMRGIAAAIIMAGATGAAAQGAGSQVAAAAAGATPGGTIVSPGARANFVISRTIGLGRLDISSLTGGMVHDGDAPRVSATSDGDATATESSDAGDAGDTTEAETAALIETTIEAIQQTTTIETQTIDTTFAAIEPDPVSPPSDDSPTAGNNGVGGGVGGGQENNRGVGGGVGGGKTGNRGGKE